MLYVLQPTEATVICSGKRGREARRKGKELPECENACVTGSLEARSFLVRKRSGRGFKGNEESFGRIFHRDSLSSSCTSPPITKESLCPYPPESSFHHSRLSPSTPAPTRLGVIITCNYSVSKFPQNPNASAPPRLTKGTGHP